MAKINIAVIQLHTKPLEIEENFTRACDFIRQAAARNAQLVVLPEYHLNGYLPQDLAWIEQTSQYEEYVQKYCALAQELSICLVPGTIIERHRIAPGNTSPGPVLSDEEGDYQLFNVAYFISESGAILGRYAKKNLWDKERLHQSPGLEKHSAIETPLGKIGLLICWDLAFPEAFRALIRDGAQTIIVPTCWTLDESLAYGLKVNPAYEALFLNSMITARCFENTCAVVFANAGGPADVYVGQSQVAMPFIGPVGGVLDHVEGMMFAEVDIEVLRQAELNYRVREDICREDWHYK